MFVVRRMCEIVVIPCYDEFQLSALFSPYEDPAHPVSPRQALLYIPSSRVAARLLHEGVVHVGQGADPCEVSEIGHAGALRGGEALQPLAEVQRVVRQLLVRQGAVVGTPATSRVSIRNPGRRILGGHPTPTVRDEMA